MNKTEALVYVMVSFNGRVLYVGQTSNFSQRWSMHRDRSPWTCYVREIHTGPMKPLPETRADERESIDYYRPLFNQMHNEEYEELGKTARANLYADRLAELRKAWDEIPAEVVERKWAQIRADREAAGIQLTPVYDHNLYPAAIERAA